MSDSPKRRVRLPELIQKVRDGGQLTMLTSYDALTAPIFERAGIDMLLVGDSLGNVMLGYKGTLRVDLDDMIRATAAVARSTSTVFIVADLPFGTYEADSVRAFEAAAALMRAGAHAVKLEGGEARVPVVETLVQGGIPVVGHLGYTPQSEHAIGGPRIQGRGTEAKALIADADALAQAGAFAIVLEMVPASLARDVTKTLRVATIGIGAGPHCNGQVLVWSDMAGMTEWNPSFARRFAELGSALEDASRRYIQAVESQTFPGEGNYRQD